mgnify:CR=1 FL=1
MLAFQDQALDVLIESVIARNDFFLSIERFPNLVSRPAAIQCLLYFAAQRNEWGMFARMPAGGMIAGAEGCRVGRILSHSLV